MTTVSTDGFKNFYCISLVFNPIRDSVPEIFKAKNKHKKEAFTHHILRKNSEQFYSHIILLKTCQRIELYIESEKNEKELKASFEGLYKKYFKDTFCKKLKIFSHREGVMHITRLASGLESFITGENEIYEQIKKLSAKYHEDGLAGDFIYSVFVRALKIAKDARKIITSKHTIHSYSEISLAFTTQKKLLPKNIRILGTGLLAESVSAFWVKHGAKILSDNKHTTTHADIVINCDARTETKIIKKYSTIPCIDFSIPPLLDQKTKPKNYFYIKNFKRIIEDNNTKLRISAKKTDGYIQTKISTLKM